MSIERRQVLLSALGTIGLIGCSRVFATPDEVVSAIRLITDGADIERGALTLTVSEIAENGYVVPVSVKVDSDMINDDTYVESIAVFADENPSAEVITFNFTQYSGEVFAATRMRLARTQNVIAVAKLNDGSVFMDTKHVSVTVGGCGV